MLTEFECLRSLIVGIIQVAHIQIEQPAIFQHAADAMMMIVVAINFFSQIKIGKSFGAKFLMLPQQNLLLVTHGNCLRALAAFSFRINLLSHLKGHQPLHVSDVGQRPCQISVVGICFLKVLDGPREKLQGLLIMSLSPHHAAMRGINVPQRDVVVAVAERGFGLVQNARSIAILPFLE